MKSTCKICKKYVSNTYGYCPNCWIKLGKKRQQEIIENKAEKQGNIKHNLEKFI